MKKIILLLVAFCFSICGYSQLALEGFESTTGPDALPSTNWTLGTGNWAVFDNAIGTTQRWGINNTVATPPIVFQGANAAYINRETMNIGDVSEDFLATPLVNIPVNGQLHFFTRSFAAGNQGTVYQIRVAPASASQTNPAAYTVIQQWTEADLTTTFNIYEEKVVNFPSIYQNQQVYISFVKVHNQQVAGVNGAGDRWLIDNVRVVQQCLDPTALTANGITQTSANLSWGNPSGATSWEIEVIPAAGTPSGTGIVYNGTLPYTATTTSTGALFTPSTGYKYYVRALCSSGANSLWIGPFPFSTTSPGFSCSAPIVIGTLPYSTTDNTANYSDNTTIEGSPGATGCGSANSYLNGNDVVYSYTATTNGVINVTMTPTATFSGIFVYNSCANIGVSCIAGVANSATTVRTFDLTVTAGTTYYIVISTWATPQTTAYTLTLQSVNCTPPTTLSASNIGQNSAQLSWANPGGASSWQVAVQTAGSPIPSGSGVTANTNTNFPVSGLTAATNYQYYVRANCGDGTFSAWTGPFLFSTSICDVAQQCSYSFVMRDTFGDGWNGGTFQVRQNGIVVATLTGPTAADGQNPVTVTVAMCNNTPFDLFWNVAGTFPGEIGVTVINSFGQTIFVKAPGSGTAGTVLYNGNVNCLVPECLAPTALTATNISETGALLGWTTSGPETSWQVLVQAAGLPAPTSTSTGWIVATTNPFYYTGLTSGTSYDFYVRPVCSTTNIGAWSIVKNFNTSVCSLANQCNYTFTMTDSFGDGWNGGTMQVRQNGVVIATLTGPTAAQGITAVSVLVPLCHGIPFELFWNNGGQFPGEMGISIIEALAPQSTIYTKPPGTGTANTLLFSGIVECFPASCPKPNTITTTSITQTSASIGWTEAGTATQWEVLILPVGSPTPLATAIGILTSLNPYPAIGLTAATGYDVYVRAICSASDKSYWSNKRTFYTLIANDECVNATVVPVNPSIECVQTVSGSLIGATASPQANTCNGTDDDDVWFQFTATSTSHSVTLSNVLGSTTDLFHVLYSGNCSSLNQLYCSDNNQSIANNLVIGQTYFIRVYSWTATPGQTTTFNVCIGTIPPPISTNNTQYTTIQLVEDVFLNSTCASVTNVTSSTGTNFGSTNGIAYFNQNGSGFPFSEGIVLTTGNAMSAPGPNTTTLGDGVDLWPGDADLESIILASTGNPMNSRNATKLEFDFVPLVNTINFNFVFASEEYGTFQCAFSDAFAFLLTDISTGITTNLAVIPNTTTPVSVVTIRDSQYNNNCISVNPDYFDAFYGFGGLDPIGSPTNFNGITVPLTATATVIPGNQYHIKLVIADRLDNNFDSAVFLEGGSLDIGTIELGDDFLQANNTALCTGTNYTITSGLSPSTYTFTWTNGNNPIPNETGPNLTISQAGVYTVTVQSIGTTCTSSDTITIEYYDPIVPGTPNDLILCNSTGFAEFDLSQNNAAALGGLNAASFNVSYYANNSDAAAATNSLPLLYTNTTANTQIIYARIEKNSTDCFEIRTFNLIVNPLVTPLFSIPGTICNGDIAPTLPLTSQNGITGTWSPSVVDNTQTLTYTFTPNPGQCAATIPLVITVNQACSFGSYASAVWLTNCADNNFFNTVGSGTTIIGPVQNIFPNNDFGTYISNSNTFKLRGAELKTFKTATANVCSARLNYRIYPQSGTPGTFSVLNLPFFDNCVSGSFPSGGPCNPGDQKWQKVLSDTEFPVDLTAFPPGNYVIEVFYDITGDVNSTTQCDDTILINNNGANFIATYTLQNNPTYTFSNPTICGASDGTITIENLAPDTVFSLTYTDDSTTIGPIIINSNATGQATLSSLNAGVYANFNYTVNSCSFSTATVITLTQQPVTPTFNTPAPICSGDTLNALPTVSNEGISGTWSPALNNLSTTTYTFTPNTINPSPINLIVNGDFSQGNTAFSTDYQYVTNAGVNGVQKAYGIVTAANSWFQFFPACTSNAPSGGNMMVIDGSTSNGGNDKVWGQTVAVQPNQTYTLSYWLQTIAMPNPAVIEVTINGVSLGIITAPLSNCLTNQYNYTWNSGSNTTAQIAIYDRITPSSGNDFSLDDISFVANISNPCATTTTLTITVNQPTPATFSTIPAICSGGIAPSLPVTSLEGFTGSWVPSFVDNTQTLPYTFTPTPGQCATSGNVSVTVTPNVTPIFAIGTSITACAGASLQVLLPTISDNGITGTWNPSTLDYSIIGTTVYTFTPTTGLCATTTTLTAVINPNTTPTFTQVPPICSGRPLNPLPTSSIEGITGTWSPALNNLATTTYTFTPTAGLCAVSNTMVITVNPNITPTFTAIPPLCVGETAPSLPITSIEGITGTWSPTSIDNTISGIYTFTPGINECATIGSLSVTVQDGFDFEIEGSCVNNDFILEVKVLNNSFDIDTAEFEWFNSNLQSVGNNSNTFNVTEYLNSTTAIEVLPLTFSAGVSTATGCYKTKPVTLERIICGIQKGISSNNDGDNEFFDLQLFNVKHLSIFNRSGLKVYSMSNYTNQWIGQSDNGDQLPDGTYYYVIDFNDNLPAKTGWIYKISEK
jgi:gliding motility-associated-like protein